MPRPMCLLLVAALVLLAPPPRAAAQDTARARCTVALLSSPRLHGRGYVQGGAAKAAAFIAEQFRRLGLQPLAPGYRQPFTLDVNTFPGPMALRLDGRPLRPGVDFIAEPASGGGRLTGPVVRLDSLIFTDEAAGQRFLAQPLAGKVLVLHQRDAERLRTLPDAFARHLGGAAARLTLVPRKLTASLAAQQAAQPQLQVLAERWPATGAQQADLNVGAQLQRGYPTHNVVGYVRGRVQPDSFLVVTAHYDHLGRLGKATYFPGANDNASGTALLLELAAHYARHPPAYSVAFLAFGAEEAGLLGSTYFVRHPLLPLERIRFLVNLDLEGTGQQGATVVNGRLHEAAFRRLEQLNQQGHYLPNVAARGRAANSDHYPFSEAGVPAFFIYLRGTPAHYHDVFDRSATLPLTGFAGTFRLVVDFLADLGGA